MALEIKDGVLQRFIPDGETQKIIIPDGVTEIAEDAFRKSAVQEIIFPQTLQKIGKRAFQNCSFLQEVQFPASLREIEQSAFQRCDALHTIAFAQKIPDSMGRGAFYDSAHIQRIRCGSNIMELDPYFADLEIPVKYTRTYPDMLLTGLIRYADVANVDERLIRMMFDFYELFHSYQIRCAFRDNAYYLIKKLIELNDAKRLIIMLKNHELLDYDTVKSAVKFHDLFAQMLLDYYEKVHLTEIIPEIQEYAHLFFAAFLLENHTERAVSLLNHRELLTEKSIEKMVETAIKYTQAGHSAELQMLAMNVKNQLFGTKQNQFRL